MQLKNRQLSFFQALMVIVVVAALGGLTYGLYLAITNVIHRREVNASIPKYLDGLRSQREVLSKAIERYRAQFGFYPQNGNTNVPECAKLNPLYYELVGTSFNTNNQRFRIPGAKETIDQPTVQKAFKMQSFSNSLISPQWPTNFLGGLGVPGWEEGEVIMVSSTVPDDVSMEIDEDYIVSPWRYNATRAEHNQGKYDLWVEVTVLGRHFVVGNWDAVR